jgi:YfiH family protein
VLALGGIGGGVRYAFTTRAGGVSGAPFDSLNLSLDVGDDPAAVATNRRRVLDRLGLPGAVWLKARHGGEVVEVDDPDIGVPQVDAMVTAQPGLPLAALSADCALIVLGDPGAGVIGVAHCGRPGLTAGVVANTVGALRDLGAASIRAAIGPSVCASCYEVPRELAEAVWRAVPASRARTRDGRFAIDIAAGITAQLAGEGVELVRHVAGCTREDPALFSYRRDRVTGRMAAIVWRSA